MTVEASVEIGRRAYLSEDGVYRYQLGRYWAPEKPIVAWVMLNPSTADAHMDDATIRRCVTFSQGFGFGSLTVVNLFAYRATKPKDLLSAIDPFGQFNGDWIREQLAGCEVVICAWGGIHPKLRKRAKWVFDALKEHAPKLRCLGTTQKGSPRHPLYLRGDTPLENWPKNEKS